MDILCYAMQSEIHKYVFPFNLLRATGRTL
jgi:hypothetical protein